MIVLVSIASPIIVSHNKSSFNCAPLGLLYVGGALKKAGFDVKIYHIAPHEIGHYATLIIKQDPLFVGFTSLTGLPVQKSAEMSKLIKRSSNLPIVWGGIHPSLLTEQVIKEDYVDFVVIGEGDVTAVELANAIKHKKDFKDIKSIAYKKNGKIYINERRPFIENLDEHTIDWDLIDIKRYILPISNYKKGIQVVTSRGCPYNCAFCYNQVFNKRTWRPYSVKHVLNELKMFKDNYGIEAVTFLDDNFFVDKNRSYEILEKMSLAWTGDCRVNVVDDTFVKKIRETNCQALFFGCESGSERILELINKYITVEQTITAIKKLAQASEVNIKASFILGFPTETREEIKSTVDLILKLGSLHPYIYFNVGLYMPYPGTSLYELALQKGFIPPQTTEEWGKYDIMAGQIEAVWSEWASKNRKKITLTHSYAKVYSGQIFGKYWNNNLIAKLMRILAYRRIKHQFFGLPYDLKMIHLLRQNVDNGGLLYKLMKKKS